MEPKVKIKSILAMSYRFPNLRQPVQQEAILYTDSPGLTVTLTNPSPKAFSLETATLKA
jgi:hypothetical protein